MLKGNHAASHDVRQSLISSPRKPDPVDFIYSSANRQSYGVTQGSVYDTAASIGTNGQTTKYS